MYMCVKVEGMNLFCVCVGMYVCEGECTVCLELCLQLLVMGTLSNAL